ncbi:DUF4376 domain-containing protein [Pseudorhodoplanes sp.]|uniref:DUF4376 domain-containing protein n=1 Tax=Pseudorhodoplanes sp. TaxID=1934341 RepID=UPI003918D83E
MSLVISNLRYADPQSMLIDMDVTKDGETFPFTYAADDSAPLSNEVRALLQVGSHPVEAYAEPVPDAASLRAYAAGARWRKETAGLAVGSFHVATDDRSKALIQGAYLQAQRDPAFTAQWKTASGSFVTITAAAIEAVALAVAAHIQACFAKEAEVVQAIDNHVIDSFAQIDAAFDALT